MIFCKLFCPEQEEITPKKSESTPCMPCPWPLLLSWVSEVLLITVIFTVMLLQKQWEWNHHLISLELLHRCQARAGFSHFSPGLFELMTQEGTVLTNCIYNCGAADELQHPGSIYHWAVGETAGKQTLWLAGCAACDSQGQRIFVFCVRTSTVLFWLT